MQPFAVLAEIARGVTEAARALLAAVRRALARKPAEEKPAPSPRVPNGRDPSAAFLHARRRMRTEDASVADFGAALALLRRGYPPDAVEAAILSASPGLADRHHAPEAYARRTVRKASTIVASTPSNSRARGPRPSP